MNKTLDVSRYQAVDPVSLILPPSVYVKLIEGKYPHVPLTEVIDKAVATLSKEDKHIVLERAKALIQCGQVVVKAVERS